MERFTENTEENKNEIIEQLFIVYSKLMYYISYRILKDRYLAEDAVQKAFLKLKKNTFNIDFVSSRKTRTFIIILIRNIAIDIYNQRKSEASSLEAEELEELTDGKLLPLDLLINKEKIEQIKDRLITLDDKYSDIIVLKYFNGLSAPEISSVLDISESLVRVRLYRGKKALLKELIEEQNNENS